jgi:hypothetical protein
MSQLHVGGGGVWVVEIQTRFPNLQVEHLYDFFDRMTALDCGHATATSH